MPDRDDWEAAIAAGLVDRDRAERLAAFFAARDTAPAIHDAEEVRFVRGFHDVFLAIGVAILVSGVAVAATLLAGIVAGLAAPAAVAWGLAEVFTRRRRLVLPSIVLAAGFSLLAGLLVGTLAAIGAGDAPADAADLPTGISAGWIGIAGAAGGVLGALGFYARFRLPFALGAAALAAIVGVVIAVGWWSVAPAAMPLVFLAAGLATFVAAMAFDLRDPGRRTLDADKAFWLHLVAAPVILHAVIGLLGVTSRFELDTRDAVVVIAVVAALGVVALAIDRRALLVSGLGYLGFAIGRLMEAAAATDGAVVATSLVVLGLFIVALGAGWQPARRAVLAVLPRPLAARLPPPVGARSTVSTTEFAP